MKKIKAITDDAIIEETLATARLSPLSIAPFKGMNSPKRQINVAKTARCEITLF